MKSYRLISALGLVVVVVAGCGGGDLRAAAEPQASRGPKTCEDRCSDKADRCSSNCGTSESCYDHCSRAEETCEQWCRTSRDWERTKNSEEFKEAVRREREANEAAGPRSEDFTARDSASGFCGSSVPCSSIHDRLCADATRDARSTIPAGCRTVAPAACDCAEENQGTTTSGMKCNVSIQVHCERS